jgi:hypothetical protein
MGLNPDCTIIFIHTPKAAGSTLWRVIHRQYDKTSCFQIKSSDSRDYKELPIEERRQKKILRGHIYYGTHEFVPGPFTYITMLRDPVDRIISHYYFVLRTPHHGLYDEVTSRNLTLRDYVLSGLRGETNNGQTRLIAGEESTSLPYGQCPPELLETAKRNIEKDFTLVGLTERFDETLILLKRAFGWKTPFYVKMNVTKDRPRKEDIPADTLAIIEEYNQMDAELYRYAQQLFDEKIRAVPDFKRELRRFQLLNRWFSTAYPLYLKAKNGTLPQRMSA